MKKTLIALMFVALTLFICYNVGARTIRTKPNHETTIWVTSNPVMTGGYQPGRRYYLGINEGTQYLVRHATWPVTQASIAAVDAGVTGNIGKPINCNRGWWEDDFNMYQSSWYVVLSSPNATGSTTTVRTKFTWHERF